MYEQRTRWSAPAFTVAVAAGAVLTAAQVAVSFLVTGPARLIALVTAGLTGVLVLGFLIIFRTLRVRVGDEELTVGYGPFRTSVPLAEITSFRPVTYDPWSWGGFGIRIRPGAKLYNVVGDRGSAVEVTYGEGRRLLFSSREPQSVCQALQRGPRDWSR